MEHIQNMLKLLNLCTRPPAVQLIRWPRSNFLATVRCYLIKQKQFNLIFMQGGCVGSSSFCVEHHVPLATFMHNCNTHKNWFPFCYLFLETLLAGGLHFNINQYHPTSDVAAPGNRFWTGE